MQLSYVLGIIAFAVTFAVLPAVTENGVFIYPAPPHFVMLFGVAAASPSTQRWLKRHAFITVGTLLAAFAVTQNLSICLGTLLASLAGLAASFAVRYALNGASAQGRCFAICAGIASAALCTAWFAPIMFGLSQVRGLHIFDTSLSGQWQVLVTGLSVAPMLPLMAIMGKQISLATEGGLQPEPDTGRMTVDKAIKFAFALGGGLVLGLSVNSVVTSPSALVIWGGVVLMLISWFTQRFCLSSPYALMIFGMSLSIGHTLNGFYQPILLLGILFIVAGKGLYDFHRVYRARLDVATIFRAERAAEQAQLAAKESALKVAAFEAAIENLTHDLRTPIAQVQLVLDQAAQMTKDGKDPTEFLRIGTTATFRLSGMVNDILELTRNEMEQSKPIPRVFNIHRWIRDLVEPFEVVSDLKGVDLVIDDQLTVDCVEQDQHRLDRIMANLIDNAIKYTNRGSVTVELSNTLPLDGACDLVLSVKDTGIGIPADEVDGIFDKFGRAKNHFAIDGIGLGLSLVSKFVSQLGATCDVKSVLNVGTRFTVTVPCAVVQELTSQAAKQIEENGLSPRILFAEDDPLYRQIAGSVLEPFGDVTFAKDGEEAVQIYKEQTFDAVFMDVRMPKVNGISATQRIRTIEMERNAKKTPIWGVSANADVHKHEIAEQVGMDGLFAKPIDVALVRSLMGSLSAA